MLGERAYDDVGEFAGNWPDVPDEARQELDALLSAWISKHCPATFYRVIATLWFAYVLIYKGPRP